MVNDEALYPHEWMWKYKKIIFFAFVDGFMLIAIIIMTVNIAQYFLLPVSPPFDPSVNIFTTTLEPVHSGYVDVGIVPILIIIGLFIYVIFLWRYINADAD
jgi:hypothetical protein